MRKILPLFCATSLTLACQADPQAGPSAPPVTPSKALVVYFSHSGENYGVGTIQEGNTQKVANEIARQTNATVFRIQTVQKYPADYHACTERAKNEQDTRARPALTARVENMDQYDVIYLGYPIWWGDMPMAVFTFIESYNLSGKTIHPFATHEGSGMGRTETSLKKALPNATVTDGLAIKGHVAQKDASVVQTAVRNWLKTK